MNKPTLLSQMYKKSVPLPEHYGQREYPAHRVQPVRHPFLVGHSGHRESAVQDDIPNDMAYPVRRGGQRVRAVQNAVRPAVKGMRGAPSCSGSSRQQCEEDAIYRSSHIRRFLRAWGAIIIVTYAGEFTGSVAGLGFLALASLIFGQWKPLGVLAARLFFCFARTVANVSQVIPSLAVFPPVILKLFPYIVTLIALVVFSKSSNAPKAAGEPFDSGKR